MMQMSSSVCYYNIRFYTIKIIKIGRYICLIYVYTDVYRFTVMIKNYLNFLFGNVVKAKYQFQ